MTKYDYYMNNGFSKPIKRGLTTLAMVIAFS